MNLHTCNKRGRFVILGLFAVLLLLVVGFSAVARAAPTDSTFMPGAAGGGTVDKYSAWVFTWDRDYNALLHPIDSAMNGIANIIMIGVALLAKYTVKVVIAAFSTDMVVQFTNNIAMPFVRATRLTVWEEYVPYLLGIAGMMALFYRVKQETTRAWGTILMPLAVLLVSLWAFANLGDFVALVDGTATSISGAVFTAAASVNPGMPAPAPGETSKDAALDYAGTQIFQNVALVPWCLGEFGSIATCQEQAGADGFYGSKILSLAGKQREDAVKALSDSNKEWMQPDQSTARVIVAIVALLLAIICCLLLLLMGAMVVFWQAWVAILLSLFTFVALISLWPGAERVLTRWVGKLAGALFMKVGLALVLGVVLAFSSTLWAMMESWAWAVFLQMALTAGIIVNRHVFTGLVMGIADAGHAIGGAAALDHKPTGGFLGGVASDTVRRGARDAMIGGAGRAASWVGNIPQRRRDSKIEGLAEKSLLGRYAQEKQRSAHTGKPSNFVRGVQERLQRGEAAFTPEQLEGEKRRLQQIAESGKDPRHALLQAVETNDHNAYTLTQQAWEADIASAKRELSNLGKQYRPMARANVQRQRPTGRLGQFLGGMVLGGRKPPAGATTATARSTSAGGAAAGQGGGTATGRKTGGASGQGGGGAQSQTAPGLRKAPHLQPQPAAAAGGEAPHGGQPPQAAQPPMVSRGTTQPFVLQNAPIVRDGQVLVPADRIRADLQQGTAADTAATSPADAMLQIARGAEAMQAEAPQLEKAEQPEGQPPYRGTEN